jgi:NTE family protein
VAGFRSLNFTAFNINALIRRGQLAADSMLPRLECPPRAAAGQPSSRPPVVIIADSSTSEARDISRLLGLAGGDSLDGNRLRSRLLKLGASDRFNALWLHPAGQGDTIVLHVQPERGARRIAAVGAAYDNDQGGRFWAGAVDRTLLPGTEASILGAVGNLRKDVTVALQKQRDLLGQVVIPRGSFGVRFDHVRQFDSAGEQVAVARTRQAEGRLGVERPFFRTWSAEVSGSVLWWRNPDRSTQDALGARFELSHVDRDLIEDFRLRATWNEEFKRIVVDVDPSFQAGRLVVNPHLRAGAGTDLPLQYTLPLGGDDGFAGYHIGELRGDREAFGGLALAYPLLGRLYVRAEVMAGRVATGGGLLDDGGWHTGARGGVAADTPVGPMRVEFGISGDREALFVRLGRWF